MKSAPDCYDCLKRLILQASNLATDDTLLRQRAVEEATRILDGEFSYSQLSIAIATKIHNVIREVTDNPDPYKAMKEKEMIIARELYLELSLRAEAASRRRGRKRSNLYKDSFRDCL